MDVLGIEVRQRVGFAERIARLLVNGEDLVNRVGAYERPFAGTLAGAYEGLTIDVVAPPSRHLLGEADAVHQRDDGRTELLACECGEPGCWPLTARITVTPDTVTWSEFAQPHRPGWSYSGLGPFVFGRPQYEAALRAIGSLAADA